MKDKWIYSIEVASIDKWEKSGNKKFNNNDNTE